MRTAAGAAEGRLVVGPFTMLAELCPCLVLIVALCRLRAAHIWLVGCADGWAARALIQRQRLGRMWLGRIDKLRIHPAGNATQALVPPLQVKYCGNTPQLSRFRDVKSEADIHTSTSSGAGDAVEVAALRIPWASAAHSSSAVCIDSFRS